MGEVGSEINIKAYISIPGMEIALHNFKEELCHYFSMQDLSKNTGINQRKRKSARIMCR